MEVTIDQYDSQVLPGEGCFNELHCLSDAGDVLIDNMIFGGVESIETNENCNYTITCVNGSLVTGNGSKRIIPNTSGQNCHEEVECTVMDPNLQFTHFERERIPGDWWRLIEANKIVDVKVTHTGNFEYTEEVKFCDVYGCSLLPDENYAD